jgi:hypothetical protein
MNAHRHLLPGERPPAPGQPEGLTVIVNRLPLDAFRLVHTDELSWDRHVAERFAVALFVRSKVRRINAGHKQLMIEAARLVIKDFEPAVRRIYQERGMIVLLTHDAIDELATALAAEMRRSRELKREVISFISDLRRMIGTDEVLSNRMPLLTRYVETEEVAETMNRWIDHAEYIKSKGDYASIAYLHRVFVCCARVHDAVFSS